MMTAVPTNCYFCGADTEVIEKPVWSDSRYHAWFCDIECYKLQEKEDISKKELENAK